MIFSQEKSFCYVAVPKTGSSSISKHLLNDTKTKRNMVLTDAGLVSVSEHVSAAELIHIMGKDAWKELYSCGFVRNPFSRTVSAYHFYRTGRAASLGRRLQRFNPKASVNVILAKLLPFTLWIRLYRPRQYFDYLSDGCDEIAVSEVFRFEEIETAFGRLTDRLGLDPVPLTRQNTTVHQSYTAYFNERARQQVEKVFAKDIRHFGYSFGDPG